ncbi:hypothetical protein [Hymenobacter crusticola]|uniref:Uncharacterized protein n=1 Tax=Hymenobacter crusticola TaxID=1770526 RepID=A0A243W7F9_9BACT|nr:hypothetical protein [Hymenobacter crusticola]OUJ69129.1 hypothetical protein BXP70_26970 [Hymenobacter crusticola]
MNSSYKFTQLGTDDWTFDSAFLNIVELREEHRVRLRQEKGTPLLFHFIFSLTPSSREKALTYLRLPGNTIPFLQWVIAWVSYRDKLPAGKIELELFDYEKLYEVWSSQCRDMKTDHLIGRIFYFADGRVTDYDGNLLS